MHHEPRSVKRRGGGQKIQVDAPLDVLPVFGRDGAGAQLHEALRDGV